MKALFIGLGSIGQRHLRNLKYLRPDAQIAAVRSHKSAPVLSELNQVIPQANIKDHYNINEFHSLSTALTDCPDLIFVTNPSSMHIDASIQAVNSGAYVFVEKPLSHNWKGVEELLQAEKNQGRKKVTMGYQYRFHPAMQLVKSILDKSIIGHLVGARLVNGEYMPNWHPYEDYRTSYAARKDLGGGDLVTQIHDFDYALWLFGQPKQIFAVGGHLSSLEIDVEDSVQVLMQCESEGCELPVSISMDYLQWPSAKGFTIVGDAGRIVCDITNSTVSVSNLQSKDTEFHEFPDLNRNDIFLDEMRNFLSFASGDTQPIVDLTEGIRSLRIALAAKESIKTKKCVTLSWN